MAIIYKGKVDGSLIGNPTGTDLFEFYDTNNLDKLTTRDSSGVDIVYGTGGGGDLLAANNLSDVALAFAAFNNIKQNGTTTFTGVGEIATQTEVNTGTDSTRWVTPQTLTNWYKPVVICCPFGAKSDDTGKFLIANGKSSDNDDGTKAKTRQPITVDGKLIRLSYKTKDGTTSTQMKIHINGVVEETVVLSSMNANSGGVETIDVDVVAGDYVEIEYDASDKPGECTMNFLQEL